MGETICVDTVRMDDCGAGPRNSIDLRQEAVEHVWDCHGWRQIL